jgi:hypothetical protein
VLLTLRSKTKKAGTLAETGTWDRGPEVARVEKQAGRELDWSPAFQNFIVTKKSDPSDPVEFYKI